MGFFGSIVKGAANLGTSIYEGAKDVGNAIYDAPGNFADIFKAGSDQLVQGAGDLYDEVSGTNLTHESWEVNAAEAQKARDFSHQEAELAYNRQLAFANSAAERQVESLRSAGLNVGLMYGGGGGAPMVPHVPQAQSSSAAGANTNFDPTRLLSMFAMIANIKNIMAETAQRKASAALTSAQENEITSLLEDKRDLWRSQASESSAHSDVYREEIGRIKSAVRNLDMDTSHKMALVQLVQQEVLKLEQDTRAAMSIANKEEQEARLRKIEADFAAGVGGKISRWTDAVGLKGRDVTQLIGMITGLGKLITGIRKIEVPDY